MLVWESLTQPPQPRTSSLGSFPKTINMPLQHGPIPHSLWAGRTNFLGACLRRTSPWATKHAKILCIKSNKRICGAAVAEPNVDGHPGHAASTSTSIDKEANTIVGIPKSEWLTLQSPARYLGNEFGSIHKPWEAAEVRFALTYPEIYEVGASNLGHIVLYTVLNQADGLLCDRTYFPGDDMTALLQKHGESLFAVESRRPLADFDTLGFSLSHELGATNILEMLQLSKIPITAQERAEAIDQPWDVSKGSFPLIFAGGPTATSNPEPFADFFDFFALGDGEELLVEIGQCLKQCKAEMLSKDETLYRLATAVDGVYVPKFYESPDGFGGAVFPIREGVPARVKRRVAQPDPYQQIGLVPFVNTVHDRMVVEIRRGCTRGCRFCQPGMLTRPARDVDPDIVVDAVTDGIKKTGHTEFTLLSLSCSDYLSLPSVGLQIKNRVKDASVSLSLPSQRVDRFDDDIANIVTSGRKSSLTFAPEAGTQRLRDIINKGLTNEELLRGIKTAWARGWKQVKLYFMIGLPGETDADVMGIAETIRWLQQECRRGREHLAVNVTISNFTPKAHTPFQWHSVSTSEFERKQSMLREAFSSMRQVKANFTAVQLSAMDDFIGRGDRSIGMVIRRAWELGALNVTWWENWDKAYAAWSQAIEEANLTWKYREVNNGEWNVLGAIGDGRYRKQGGGGKGRIDRGKLADARLDMPLPWDHIDTGISKSWLKTDLQKALEAATVPDCSHSGLCSECGVCGDDFGENVFFEPPPVPTYKGHQSPDQTKAQRLRFRFTKGGDMVFIGHLDMVRVFIRAARRAGLPVTADRSQYNARPQIIPCLPLPLGATSTCELIDFFLTQKMDPETAKNQLQAQLPAGVDLTSVMEVPIKKLDGSLVEGASTLLQYVEYLVLLKDENLGPGTSIRKAVAAVNDAESLIVRKETKKGMKETDLRTLIKKLEVCKFPFETETAQTAPEAVGEIALTDPSERSWGIIRCQVLPEKPGQNPMGPRKIVEILNEASGADFRIAHVHRSHIDIGTPPHPRISSNHMVFLRKTLRAEGHAAVMQQFGMGAWSAGLQNRPLTLNALTKKETNQ